MKQIRILIVLTAAVVMAWGCSSDDDSETAPVNTTYIAVDAPSAPSWNNIRDIDWQYNEPRPNWTDPDPLLYESTMILQVTLDADLIPYASSQDLMSVTLGNECRAVSMCNIKSGQDGQVAYFIMAIKGNHSDSDAILSVNYYCERLRQTFIMKDIIPFIPEYVYGIDDDTESFQPFFSMGSTKYPVKPFVSISLEGSLPFTGQAGDKLALYVGDECRGSADIEEDTVLGDIFCVLFSKQVGEVVSVRYYSRQQARIYQLKKTFLSVEGEISVKVRF